MFENPKQYRRSNSHKLWASVAPAFLGCRLEELRRIHLKTDLVNDAETGVWNLISHGRSDPDGVVRKSMMKVSSWRHAPIHASLIQHGFIGFLRSQQQASFQRPFEKERKHREVTSEFGQIVKWSHYISRWGGRELKAIASREVSDRERFAYSHFMRYTFKVTLGDAGVPSEIL